MTRRRIRYYWHTYAPTWIWYYVHQAGTVAARVAYTLGRRVPCRDWTPEHCELLENGNYRVRFCEEPKGHPSKIPHREGVYLWRN